MLILLNNYPELPSASVFFGGMFSIEIKDFVGMCLATDSIGLINGLFYRQLISRRPHGLTNDDMGDLS
jgi:hypothetical protein